MYLNELKEKLSSFSDIAALIGSSRKTVSLLFSDLENEGIVEFFKRKEMYVPNLKNLV